MSGETNNYGLDRLGAGDDFSDRGYKFTDADRQLIDRLLYMGAEGHHHTGAAALVADPSVAPGVTLSETGGTIPAGTRVYYKYTWVDVNGFESAASPEGYVDTPTQVLEPSSPTLLVQSTGGTLLPGVYYYILSCYTNVNTQETKATAPAYVTVPVGSTTNQITLVLPTLPSGADGFNVYVKKPGQVRYNYLASVDMTIATPPTEYTDNGAVEEDCNRSIPIRNTTHGNNAAVVQVPTVPVGSTWKLYRTYQSGQYENSLVHHVVEETFETSGIITNAYADLGIATSEGLPPTASQSIGSPDKVLLTDGAEVTGILPMGRVAHPFEVTFFWPGTLQEAVGTMVWVCEFPHFFILGCRAALGVGFSPSAQEVIVDVNLGSGQSPTPTFDTIYTTQANRPMIEPGWQIGERTVPDVQQMDEGDMLTIDIDQTGEGATPNDQDLTVTVYGFSYGHDADETVGSI